MSNLRRRDFFPILSHYDVMSLYIIGDLHLATDPSIEDKSMDMFGGPWVNHAQRLSEIWSRLITDSDTVLIAGDISWALKLDEVAADFQWLSQLPGKKIIMKGNHDLWWSSRKKMEKQFPDFFFLQNNCYEGDNFVIAGSRGWLCPGDPDFRQETDGRIFRRELMRLRDSLSQAKTVCNDKTLIAVTHFPPVNSRKEESEITRMYEEFGVSRAYYGHLHGSAAIANAMEDKINGIEYRLVSLDRLEAAPLFVI